MVPRFLLSFLLLSSTTVFASSLALGPERELAPSTTALRFNGVAVAIGASEDGFATVWWEHPRTFRTFVTRLDTAGRPIDALGIPLPVPLSHAAVGWNGREYVIAGISLAPDGGLVLLRVAADGTVTGPEPRTIPDALYGYDLGLTWNGRVLLLTWATESLGKQRLYGMIVGADLEVLRPQFEIARREAASQPQSVTTDGRDFVVAWRGSGSFNIVNESGEVSNGAALPDTFRQPTVVDAAGFSLLWHDGTAIHAMRVASDGTALSSPTTLVEANLISSIGAASNGAEIGVAWTANDVLYAQRFDSSFNAISERRTLSGSDDCVLAVDIAASSTDVVASWTSGSCKADPIAYTASLDDVVQPISATTIPSSQFGSAVASDGERVLAVWSEQRDENPAPGIYAALLDEEGDVLDSPITISEGGAPRIAYGAGRYLVTWNEGARVVGQFVRRDGSIDGEAFKIANATSSPELVWNGDEFVLVWSDDQTLRSTRVSASGAVTNGPSLAVGANLALADITVGSGGEIVALYRAENAQRMSVRVAVLRDQWPGEQILVSVPRPCASLACDDYFPLAIGWSGARYVATWVKTGGPGRHTFMESSTFDGPPRTLAFAGSYPADVSGEMVWSGTTFLFVYRSRGVSSSWLQTHIIRLTEDGGALDANGGPRVSEMTSDAGSPPDIAFIRPNRAVVVYNRDPAPLNTGEATQRVLARSVTINPRRRAVR